MSFSMVEMLEAGVHFGHQTKFWNPKMKPYIYGVRNRIHIINLDKTVGMFDQALKFVKQVVKNKGTVLFVGTRSQAGEIVAQQAMRCGMPYVDHRWLGGMLTNFDTVKKSIKKLEDKKQILEKSSEESLSKKETLDLNREITKLTASIGGISNMKRTPDVLFVVDTGCHDIAIKEAKKLGIPVVGIVDTNNDPSVVDYIIPGNDDSAKAIEFYASKMAEVILQAKDSIVDDLVQQVKVEMVGSEDGTKKATVHRVKKVQPADEDIASEDNASVDSANASVGNTSVDNASVDNVSVSNVSVDNASVGNTSVDNVLVDNSDSEQILGV